MKRKGPQRDREKEQFWRKAVRQQQQSRQSIRDYCQEQALSEPSFYAWRREIQRRYKPRPRPRRIGPPSRSAAFVPVRLSAVPPVPPGPAAVEVALPSGAVLRLPPGTEPQTIAAVVHAWEHRPC
jgi:transposase